MELNLKPAFFWPVNRTIVRTFKFSTKLFWQRAIFRVLSQAAPRHAVERAIRVMLTPPRHPFSDAELAARLAQWTPSHVQATSGYAWLHQQHVQGADTGADLDFLKGCRGNPVGKDSH